MKLERLKVKNSQISKVIRGVMKSEKELFDSEICENDRLYAAVFLLEELHELNYATIILEDKNEIISELLDVMSILCIFMSKNGMKVLSDAISSVITVDVDSESIIAYVPVWHARLVDRGYSPMNLHELIEAIKPIFPIVPE